MKYLITGCTGFVGKALRNSLTSQGHDVICFDRNKMMPDDLSGFDAVIHLAAKVHDMNKPSYDEYYKGNVILTQKLIEIAIRDKVPKFVFLSSIKVNGEERDIPYFERDVICPIDFYGKSKWHAEELIKHLCEGTQTSFTIIRPPLIYGKDVGANFAKLISLAKKNLPLPFGGIKNKRSFIYIENLINFIELVLKDSDSNNKTYLVCDGEDVSTPQLLKKIKKVTSGNVFILPLPSIFLKIGLTLIGKEDVYRKLAGNLTVDMHAATSELKWKPPYTMDEGLKKTCERT